MISQDIHSKCSTNRNDCLTALPYDVACNILSRVDQRDSLTCMAVCHAWYNTIPQYTRSVWKSLEVHQGRRCLDSRRYVRCLGSHIKHITVSGFDTKQQDLHNTLQKLVTHNCNALNSLEFVSCKTDDQDGFLHILRQLTTHVTEISFVDHGSNLALLHVLASCPQLTRFAFKPTVAAWKNNEIYETEPRVESPLPMDLTFGHLTHLRLDTVMNSRIRVEPILQRCPNLKCFISPNDMTEMYFYPPPNARDSVVDLDKLFSSCPKLTYLDINSSHPEPECITSQGYHCFWPMIHANEGEGLRTFITREGNGYGPDQMMPHILRNADTLGYLWFGENFDYENRDGMANWSTLLRSIQANKLNTLVCRRIHHASSALAIMIHQCSALENVTVYHAYMEPQLLYNLATLPKLSFLELRHITINSDPTTHDSLAQCFLTIGARDTCVLETVHLLDTPYVSDQVINALASVKTIKTIKIASSGRYITDEGLSDFAALLAGTAVQDLELSMLRCIPYRALDALGGSPTLKSLSITYCRKVDSQGLQQILNKSSSLENLHLGGVEFMGSSEATLAYAEQRLGSGYRHSNYPIMIIGAHYM